MRTRWSTLNLGLVAVVVIVIAALLVSRGGGSSASTPGTGASRSTPGNAADTFATAYLRLLDGRLAASRLPVSSPAVRRFAAQPGNVIPAGARAGTLTLTALKLHGSGGSSGSAQTALLIARDARHTFPAQLTLEQAGGGWQVTGLVPPDFGHILQRPVQHLATPSAAAAAASAFAEQYVAYREHATGRAPGGLSELSAQLNQGQDALAHVHATHARPGPAKLAFGPTNGKVIDATATMTDAGQPVTVSFELQRTGGVWQPYYVLTGSAP